MITTQDDIDQLADRIEKAYRLRYPHWLATGLTPGVWISAAVRLHDITSIDPTMPIDPELFVAVQKKKTFRCDPWEELAQEGATKVYRSAVRRIVRQLKSELANELRWSNRFLESGGTLEEVLAHPKSRVSPITKLVLCHRLKRADLAETIRHAAESQHIACPLYRFACKELIENSQYPTPEVGLVASRVVANQKHSFSWN